MSLDHSPNAIRIEDAGFLDQSFGQCAASLLAGFSFVKPTTEGRPTAVGSGGFAAANADPRQ